MGEKQKVSVMFALVTPLIGRSCQPCQTQLTRSRRLKSNNPSIFFLLSQWGGLGALLDIQDVIEIGYIANSQSEYLDLGEFLVRGQRGE